MSNNFPTFSRIFFKILSILVNIVLSMKSLGLDAIHFRILTINRLCFSNVFGKIFSFKNCFTPHFWHMVKRELDWTGKTRTGLRLVKRGLDSISKTRTGLY